MRGRAQGPRLVMKCALGPPADKVSAPTKDARSWGRIAAWVKKVLLAAKNKSSWQDPRKHLGQAARVAKRKLAATWKWQWGDKEEQERAHELMYRMAHVEWDSVRDVARLQCFVNEELQRTTRKATRKENTRYREWIQGGRAAGLARQHAASKCSGQWVPSRRIKVGEEDSSREEEGGDVGGSSGDCGGPSKLMRAINRCVIADNDGHCPIDLQTEVNLEAEKWAREWAVGECREPCSWPEDMGTLRPIKVRDLLDAANSFSEDIGLGWDRLHPRALNRLPEHLLERLCGLLMKAEEEGDWTEAVGLVIIALLPKSDGGWRPIGLLPTIIRVWARTRRAEGDEWEGNHNREFLYGGKQTGAQVAAWKHALRAEVAGAAGLSFAAVMTVLEKAFDRVTHARLVAAARQWGYPLRLLRLSIAS